MNKEKITIIGAGAAGLAAAIFAAESSKQVLLLERTEQAGKKILISGGARCNVLPITVAGSDFTTSSSPYILNNILKSWNILQCFEWFTNDIGLTLEKEEATNKYFPASQRAKEVRDLLVAHALKKGVTIHYNNPIKSILYKDGRWNIMTFNSKTFQSELLVIGTGGLSFPQLGTDGSGHALFKKSDHSMIAPYPALTPLLGKHPGAENLAGMSLDVDLGIKLPKKNIHASRKGFLFTRKGFSGPAILDMSHYAVQALESGKPAPGFTVNWARRTANQWEAMLLRGNQLVQNKVSTAIPARLARALCSELGLEKCKISEFPKDKRIQLIKSLTEYKLSITGHEGYSRAEVTGGGIRLEDINAATMQSKLMPNLYVCGEILDSFGRIGGFNFYWAWVTGRLAGLAAARE